MTDHDRRGGTPADELGRHDTHRRTAGSAAAGHPREGYDAAAAVAQRSGSTVAGWKIAATSEAGQKHINVDGPIIGRILKSRLLPPGAP